MELEEMKTLWEEMSKEMEKQKILTNKLIIKMTQERYNSRLRKISVPETVGAVICFTIVLFIIFNFGKLDTWYLMVGGIFIITYLLVLPVFVLKSIYKMQNINVSKKNFKQTLIDFTQGKKRFFLIQKIGIYLNFILIIISLPVAGKLMDGKDIFMDSNVWFWYIPVMVLFLILFSRWGYRHYSKTTTSAENLLKELEE